MRSVRSDVHPPLYHLLLRGALAFGDSEAALRFPSALFGTLSIPALYLLGRAWFSGSVGALAALLLALSSGHIWHSRDARMYSLLTLEGILSWYFFGTLLEVRSRAKWIGYVLSSGAILYTHYYGVLLLLPQTAVVFLLNRHREIGRSFCACWLMVQGSLALLVLPWFHFAAATIHFGQLRWIERYHPLAQAVGGLVRLSTGYPGIAHDALVLRRPVAVLALCAALIVAGVAVVGIVQDENSRARSLRTVLRERPILLCLGYLAAPIAMMLAISLYRPLVAPRYMLMTAPPFLLLVAIGLSRLVSRRTIDATAMIVVLLAPGLLASLLTPRGPDHRGAASLIAGAAVPGDALLVYGEHPRRLLEHYLRTREQGIIWCPRSPREASVETVQRCLDGARRVWVVSDEQLQSSEQAKGATPLATRFKSVRSESLFRARVTLYERCESGSGGAGSDR